MMYGRPEASDPVDQGDVIDERPLVVLTHYSVARRDPRTSM
jgi:hypothetical protein